MQITTKKFSSILCVSLAALVMSSHNLAETQKISKQQCKILDRTDAVIIMVCPDQDAEAWQEAGKEACGLKQLCNAWIWDDETKAPKMAPITDAEIPKVNTSQAVAVWINDSKMLMTLRQVN